MTNEVEPNEDKSLLKVRGNIENKDERKTYVKHLADAIFTVIQKHGVARLRCVGAASVSNAIKGHIIANGEATKKGMILSGVPSFKTITIANLGEKTAIVIEVKPTSTN